MMLNRADECRRRAKECRRNAAQVADDVLRGTYLDLARRWRIMAHQAGSLEQKEGTKKTSGFWTRLFAKGQNLLEERIDVALRKDLGRRKS